MHSGVLSLGTLGLLHCVWTLGSEDFLDCLDFLFAQGGCGQSRTKSTLGLLTWRQQKHLWVLSGVMQKAGKLLKALDPSLEHRFNCTVEQSNPWVFSVAQLSIQMGTGVLSQTQLFANEAVPHILRGRAVVPSAGLKCHLFLGEFSIDEVSYFQSNFRQSEIGIHWS